MPSSGSREFATTHWSVVRSCSEGEQGKAQAALSQLCRTYWRPIFTFICRRGYAVADAQDLTQDFFVVVLKRNLLSSADPARGRFRSLLLKSLQNFLIDANEKRQACKRGGDLDFVSWDDWMAESPSRLSVPAKVLETWPAEQLYDFRWAATVVEQALRRLAEECESRGRRRVFDKLSGYLAAERSDVCYEELSVLVRYPGRFGSSCHPPASITLSVRYFAMKSRKRSWIRSEIDDEIQYLCTALAAADA